jgi:hypothetical protein
MAEHALLDGWYRRGSADCYIPVAECAIDAELSGVALVGEGDGLLRPVASSEYRKRQTPPCADQ